MSEPSMEQLRAEARYARDRLALYRARSLTGKPTRQMRMQELEREAQSAQQRLDRALARQREPPSA
jgi:hypothetical protein